MPWCRCAADRRFDGIKRLHGPDGIEVELINFRIATHPQGLCWPRRWRRRHFAAAEVVERPQHRFKVGPGLGSSALLLLDHVLADPEFVVPRASLAPGTQRLSRRSPCRSEAKDSYGLVRQFHPEREVPHVLTCRVPHMRSLAKPARVGIPHSGRYGGDPAGIAGSGHTPSGYQSSATPVRPPWQPCHQSTPNKCFWCDVFHTPSGCGHQSHL
jgi:hypothetical protein